MTAPSMSELSEMEAIAISDSVTALEEHANELAGNDRNMKGLRLLGYADL